jgi:hypothetical protein
MIYCPQSETSLAVITATVRLPPAIHFTPKCIVLMSYIHENKIRQFQFKTSVRHETLKEALDEVKKPRRIADIGFRRQRKTIFSGPPARADKLKIFALNRQD